MAVANAESEVDIVRIEYPERGRLPWAFSASWQAARLLRRQTNRYDVRFYHTQSVSLFAPLVSQGRPFVVSVDATPMQVDVMGRWYEHAQSASALERLKARWYRAVFGRAAAIVAWSNWAADSLVADYAVPRERIAVIHPGAPAEFFSIPRATDTGRKPVVLFVGGDLQRKGGDLLLEVFDAVRDRVDLLMVTPEQVGPRPGLEIVSDATPGSARLREAFERADFFCLPTRGDCTPLVLGEAMAAGLPVITTRIGSNAETVRDGIDGVLIDQDDATALRSAVDRLAGDALLRARMGQAAREAAEERFHSQRNAARILSLLQTVAK